MVIDFHTHIFPDSLAGRAIGTLSEKGNIKAWHDGTAKGLTRSMKKAGIDFSVFHPVVTKPSQTRTVNLWAAKASENGLIAFGGLHPQNENYKEEVDIIVSLGLKGVKLHPDYQDFFVDNAKMMPVYDYILSKGLILMFHAGVDIGFPPPYHCTPERLSSVLNEMRGGIIVAAHLGGHRMWDGVETHLAGRHVYFDTSMGLEYFGSDRLERMVRLHGIDKILFGTDSPWSGQKEELQRLKSSNLTPEELNAILYGNAARLLGI